MALKIDRWDEPQIKNQGLDIGPSSQMPTSASGGAQEIAAGGQKLATGLAHAASVIKQARDDASTYAAADREVQYARDATDLLYKGDGAFLNQKNQGAIDTAGTHEALAKLRDKYGQGLDGEALAKYNRRTAIRSLGYQEQVERHAATERKNLYTETTKAIAQESVDQAALVYNDPKKVEEAIGLAIPIIEKHLTTDLKLPADAVRVMIKQYEGEVYGAVLNEYHRREEYDAGQKYLDAIGADHLPAKVAAHWGERFKASSKEQRIERVGSDNWNVIAQEATDPVSGRFNEAAARAAFARLDVNTRALTDKDFDHRVAVQNHVQAQADTQRLGRLYADIRATGTLNKAQKDFQDLDDEGKAKAEGMLETYRRSLRGDRAQDRAIQASENSIALNEYLSDPDIRGRSTITDDEARKRWPSADERGISAITKARAHDKTMIEKGLEMTYGRAMAQVQNSVKSLRSSGSPSKKRLANDIVEEFNTWYAAESMDGPVKSEAVLNWIGDKTLVLDIPVGTPGNLLGRDKRAIQLAPGEAAKYQPAAEQPPEARAYLARGGRGAPLTTAESQRIVAPAKAPAIPKPESVPDGYVPYRNKKDPSKVRWNKPGLTHAEWEVIGG